MELINDAFHLSRISPLWFKSAGRTVCDNQRVSDLNMRVLTLN
jgi:hypothetical protein